MKRHLGEGNARIKDTIFIPAALHNNDERALLYCNLVVLLKCMLFLFEECGEPMTARSMVLELLM